MVETTTRAITFAHSPDPDDAFMFYGFAAGGVRVPGVTIQQHLEDIEGLNARAMRGDFEISAVSVHAYAYCSERYAMLSCGASVGRGYGPILISRTPLEELRTRPTIVAIPGKWTTAALVFDLWLKENRGLRVEKTSLPFDQILPAVESGQIDAGLIIHEGQLTYAEHGMQKIWDSGAWWMKKSGTPLPLGLTVIRRDLGEPLIGQLDAAFRDSIRYAQAHAPAATDYALKYGRGLSAALGEKFIGMYVNEDTLQQGKDFQEGLKQLYRRAREAGLLPQIPRD